MTAYDRDLDAATVDAATADLIAEEDRLLNELHAAKKARLAAAAKAARYQPGDRVRYADRRVAEEWQVDGIKHSGYAGSLLYVGRPIRKDGEPSNVQPRNMYLSKIEGDA